VAGERVFLGTLEGDMVCAELASGKVVWRVESPEGQVSFYAACAVLGDRVLFAGRDKVVRCVDASSGDKLWSFRARGRIDSSPVIAGRRVFFGSYDGTLHGLSLDDGSESWSFVTGAPISASPAIGEGILVIGAEDGAIYCFGQVKGAVD
jgi:outer membrane protein assembly factor BamB